MSLGHSQNFHWNLCHLAYFSSFGVFTLAQKNCIVMSVTIVKRVRQVPFMFLTIPLSIWHKKHILWRNNFRLEIHIYIFPHYIFCLYIRFPVAVIWLCQNKALDLHKGVNEIICSVPNVEVWEDYAVNCLSILPKIVLLYVKSFWVNFSAETVFCIPQGSWNFPFSIAAAILEITHKFTCFKLESWNHKFQSFMNALST